ncbi:UDP-glucose/GDP-mannose dehydrogenase family protein [bacterium]|nr:UDP-glucose/GDP-mannose dehydrogenase family protein [bacterium]
MKKIGIIGAGHVGLVTAGCFAKLGHTVICADKDIDKIEKINKLEMPFYEPGLKELIEEVVKSGNISFTTSVKEVAVNSEIIFIAVGTPATDDGGADLSYVENVTVEIAKSLANIKRDTNQPIYKLIVEKSTVPVLTGEWVKRTLALIAPTGIEFDVAANPEFLSEGNAIRDFLEPDRIVVGVENERAKTVFEDIYKSIKAPIIFTDVKSAEIIKHASNSFLALKISYINGISQICERVGADIEKVAEGMGYDKRIGKEFLRAGIGWGGGCFPKDVSAFIQLSKELGYSFDLLKEVQQINREQKFLLISKAKKMLWNLKGKKIGVLGLSFKPNTDDIRESPAIKIVKLLLDEGAVLKCYDPESMETAKKEIPNVVYCDNAYEAVEETALMLLLTEWKEFLALDFTKVKNLMVTPYIIDGRNCLDKDKLKELGFIYKGIGKNG